MPYVRLGKVRGFSPTIEVYKDENEEYILKVQNEQDQFLTPNLCGFSPKIAVEEQGDNTYVLEIETAEGIIETPNLCGFTPTITVYENTNSAYRLQITTAAGSFVTPNLRDVKYRVGSFYTQYPDEPDPLEGDSPLPGVWEVWSARSIGYGVSQSAPPSFVDYYTLAGKSIAANTTPVVCYHKAGDDFRLYRFISQSSAYSVPAELDPVKWTYLQPGAIDERQKCGNALTEDDYEIGYQITSGNYQGFYVTEVIVPGGKFTGIEGGFRPTFISGGRQEGRIKNFAGSFGAPGVFLNVYPDGGVFVIDAYQNAEMGGPGTWQQSRHRFDPSRIVPTGPDFAGTNLSTRLWRRVS